MNQISRGKVIITGASSGIGAATAERLGRDGFELILVGRSNERLKEVAKKLKSPYELVALDLKKESAPDVILAAVKEGEAPLSAIVNNAGIIHRLSFRETTEAHWREEFETNFMAPVRLIRRALALLKPGGAIVNVSSTLGLRPIANTSAYSATKAALNSLTQSLALELAPQIRVCAVCPGLIDTPIHAFHRDSDSSETRKSAHQAQPMGRMGRPEEIAAMIGFLLSPDSAWTTGSLHVVDGGISLL